MHRPLLTAALLLGLIWPTAPASAQDARADWLEIELGKSVVLQNPANATAIAITDPEVAAIVPLDSARKLQVQGKSVGSTDLVIQLGPNSEPIIYSIIVHRDLSALTRRVDALVEGPPPNIYPMQERIVVEGEVADLTTLENIAQLAAIYDEDFINLMRVKGDHQVQLQVVFAEVSRSALRELGMNVLYGDDRLGGAMIGPGSNNTPRVARAENLEQINPILSGAIPGAISGAPFNLIANVDIANVAAVLSVLDDNRISKTLAQPTVVALSGQQAEFLAGGELPIAVPSGNGMVSIRFRDYGVKLVFVPTVLANEVVDMRVYVEVSEPDYSAGTRITGVEVPGFLSRKGKSHLRVDSGMTFAMAGLLSEKTSSTVAKVPGLGDIPVIGSLFRYVRHEREETELMIFVTPRLVRPLGPGDLPELPTSTENNNPSDLELFLLGLDARPGSRTAEPTGDVGFQR